MAVTPEQIEINVVIRKLELSDIPAALTIQSEAYPPFLVEDEPVFASRLTMTASYCFAATRDGVVVAYVLAHGWPSESPPELHRSLPADAPCEVLFIHDLAVTSAGRSAGIGRRLAQWVLSCAASDGLQAAELIAVDGAARFWNTLGFTEAIMSADLANKVASYGPQAQWMRKAIVCNRTGNRH